MGKRQEARGKRQEGNFKYIPHQIEKRYSGSFSGTIERVWEDGFRLQSDNRTITVDSWDVCGDNTAGHLSAGDRVIVTGEFEGGEFDAFSITKADGNAVCQ